MVLILSSVAFEYQPRSAVVRNQSVRELSCRFTRAPASLRIAAAVTCRLARLASDLRVYALAGRDSHPLDRYSEFRNAADDVLPFRPAFPGHFHGATRRVLLWHESTESRGVDAATSLSFVNPRCPHRRKFPSGCERPHRRAGSVSLREPIDSPSSRAVLETVNAPRPARLHRQRAGALPRDPAPRPAARR